MSRDYSPLCDRINPPTGRYKGGPKWSSRHGATIRRVIAHHWATPTMAGYDRLVTSNDPASANYLILDDGTLIGSVSEKYRAWTSGSSETDSPAITVEVQNHTGSPNWTVSDAAQRTLTALSADVANYYEWSGVEIDGHRDYEATACPGPYLYPRLPDIAAQAQAMRATPQEDDMQPSDRIDITGQAEDSLGLDTISVGGAIGYSAAGGYQAMERLPRIEATLKAQSAALQAIAQSQGLDPDKIEAIVDRATRDALADLEITLTPED